MGGRMKSSYAYAPLLAANGYINWLGVHHMYTFFAWIFNVRANTRIDMSTSCNCQRCREGLEGCHWEGFALNSDGVYTYKGEAE